MVEYVIKRHGRVTKAMASDQGRVELLRAMLPADWGNDDAMMSGWVKSQEEITFLALTGTAGELRAKGWSGSDPREYGELMLDVLFVEAGRTLLGHKALQQLALRFFDEGLPIPEKLREFIRSSILEYRPKQKRNRPSGDMLHFQNSTLESLFREAMNLNSPSRAQAYKDVAEATGLFRSNADPATAMRKRLERYRKWTKRQLDKT